MGVAAILFMWTNFRFPIPLRLHMKFGFDRPSSFGEENLWKWWTTDDGRTMDGRRRTDDRPWLNYQLTNEPKGSSELKMNNNKCCQYIGCIGGTVTLSLRRWELMSLRHHIRRQLSIWQTSTYSNVTLEIKRYARNRIYHDCLVQIEKSVPQDQRWHHSAQPHDAKTDFSIRTSHPCKILLL